MLIDMNTFPGLGASLNVAKPTKGSSVAIFGLGAVGLAVSMLRCVVLLFPVYVLVLRMI